MCVKSMRLIQVDGRLSKPYLSWNLHLAELSVRLASKRANNRLYTQLARKKPLYVSFPKRKINK